MSHPDEQEWIVRARAGDRSSFAALVRCHWERVYRWLYGLTHHRQSAEDLAQEAFLRAWTHLGTLQSGGSFRAWLFRIARNCFLDSRKGHRADASQPLPERIHASSPGPLAVVLGQESRTLIERACAELPIHFRAPLLLWTHEELSYAEIAEALDVTEETARWRVCRARKLLVKALGSHLSPDTP